MYDILAFGEMLIDFMPVGLSEKGNPVFEQNPGGGPANMACTAAKMGAKAAFLGKVGDDPFGQALKSTLMQNGVDADSLILDRKYPTTLAFVHLAENGERSFSFYRHGSADTMFAPSEIPSDLLENSRCFFCSSVMMAEGLSRETSFSLLEKARSLGLVIAFDPNLRPNLWRDPKEMKEVVCRALPFADIIKVSEEEALFLSGKDTLMESAAFLLAQYAPQLLFITRGSQGCLACTHSSVREFPGFPVQAVDTTAAGDSFTGAFLAGLSAFEKPLAKLDWEDLGPLITTANAVGALTTTKKGSISALPSREEVRQFFEKNHILQS